MSGPIGFNMTKQPMFNWVPLRCARGQMRHGYSQIEFIRKLLKTEFPSPIAVAIGTATVRFNQEMALIPIALLPTPQPPLADGGHSELRRLMRRANHHTAFIPREIIDSVRNGNAVRRTGGSRFRVLPMPYGDTFAPIA